MPYQIVAVNVIVCAEAGVKGVPVDVGQVDARVGGESLKLLESLVDGLGVLLVSVLACARVIAAGLRDLKLDLADGVVTAAVNGAVFNAVAVRRYVDVDVALDGLAVGGGLIGARLVGIAAAELRAAIFGLVAAAVMAGAHIAVTVAGAHVGPIAAGAHAAVAGTHAVPVGGYADAEHACQQAHSRNKGGELLCSFLCHNFVLLHQSVREEIQAAGLTWPLPEHPPEGFSPHGFASRPFGRFAFVQ